jgi:hypothetical protein
MKKSILAMALAFSFIGISHAQDTLRCYTVEANEMLRERNPELGNDAEFEKWMAREVAAFKQKNRDVDVLSLPIVFHVLHNNQAVGTGDNLSAALLNAQLEQLNNDFRRILGSSGFNDNSAGADTQIEFCMAQIDPNGNPMAEPGINRINTSAIGLNNPGYSIGYMDNTVKPTTQWNPDQYINVWVTRINFFLGTILGYAQFPSASGLSGLNNNEGAASSDGVVVRSTTVGSTDLPNPAGGATARGRTLTHELGHFFGLRHIWGDGGCNADDFCEDTPQSASSSSGCPSNKVTCNTPDMVENYMDYSNDVCMNIFTNDQKARMQVVMNNSPRRGSLINSPACGGTVATPCENPYPQVSGLNTTLTGGATTLSWNPIAGSIACRVEGGLANGTGPVQEFQINQPEASTFQVPAGILQAGNSYRWRVRCGCSLSPIVAGPWSAYNVFAVPASITGQVVEADFAIAALYPNPGSGILNLQLTGGIGMVLLRVYNSMGQAIVERNIALNGDNLLHQLNLSNMARGIYYVQLSNAQHTETKKVVLQ